ncbi:MAG: hypothetical protein Q9214_007949, partial [Letrouitia sp. 1 TL-2023]
FERDSTWTQFYLYPKFTNCPIPQLVRELFHHNGSHIHLSMTAKKDLYELDSVVFTICAPADINVRDKVVD